MSYDNSGSIYVVSKDTMCDYFENCSGDFFGVYMWEEGKEFDIYCRLYVEKRDWYGNTRSFIVDASGGDVCEIDGDSVCRVCKDCYGRIKEVQVSNYHRGVRSRVVFERCA